MLPNRQVMHRGCYQEGAGVTARLDAAPASAIFYFSFFASGDAGLDGS
jgi:hypothetical protein